MHQIDLRDGRTLGRGAPSVTDEPEPLARQAADGLEPVHQLGRVARCQERLGVESKIRRAYEDSRVARVDDRGPIGPVAVAEVVLRVARREQAAAERVRARGEVESDLRPAPGYAGHLPDAFDQGPPAPRRHVCDDERARVYLMDAHAGGRLGRRNEAFVYGARADPGEHVPAVAPVVDDRLGDSDP